MDPHGQPQTPAAKVAIPPLRPRLEPAPPRSAAEKRRTPKACVECRSRKIKCSGKRPTCEHCEHCQIPCVYAEGKREKNKRATERSDRLLQLLGDIAREVSLPAHLNQKVQAFESEAVRDLEDDASTRSVLTTASKRRRESSSSLADQPSKSVSPPNLQGEADVSAAVGSEASVDVIEEDFNRSNKTKATGFIGKNSEVAWARRLSQAQAGGSARGSRGSRGKAYGKPGMSEEAHQDRLGASNVRHSGTHPLPPISDFTYHLDLDSVLTFDHVDKDELPPPELAELLLSLYMETVQDAFPILTKSVFLSQYRRYSHSNNPESLPATWRALLNIVFAISARFSHLVNAPWRGDERDHLVYYTRALSLGMPGDAIVAHPDLQRIQVLGLVSFYYLTISQVNRSWVMIGLACRQAMALGLHLRNLDPQKDAASKEKRVRVWWSLYYMENILGEILGRPTAIDQRFCSAPTPAPIDDVPPNKPGAEQSTKLTDREVKASSTPASDEDKPGLDRELIPCAAAYFHVRSRLSVFSQKILINLYSVATVEKSWERAQYEIHSLGHELDEWYRLLPAAYRFAHSEDQSDCSRERILLGFGYYSTKLILTRPCLCRVDMRIQKQGLGSKSLDQAHARECIMAARSMSDMLPDMDVPNVNWIYSNGPWWCIVHYLMQAMTVLMLELAFEVCHMADPPVDQKGILQTARKILRWLTAMASTGNESARSACELARRQFKGFLPFEHLDVSDLLEMAERGPEAPVEHLPKELQRHDRFSPRWLQHSMLQDLAQHGTDAEPQDFTNDRIFQDVEQESWPHHFTDDGQLWSTHFGVPVDPTFNARVLHNSYDLNNPFMAFSHSTAMPSTNPGPAYPLGSAPFSSDAPFMFPSNPSATQSNGTGGNYPYEVIMSESQQHHQPTQHMRPHTYPYSPSTQQQTYAQSSAPEPRFQPPSTSQHWP